MHPRNLLRYKPSGQDSSTVGLESDDDVGQFQVSLFLQMSKDTGAEEDLALTDAIEVGVKLQVSDLEVINVRLETDIVALI